MSLMVEDAAWACVLTFVQVFVSWSLNYVATSIESPFGDGWNDLPMLDMQQEFNHSLATLLMKEASQPPTFAFSSSAHNQVKIQSVDRQDIVNPTVYREADPSRTRVLRVLRQLSTSLEEEPEVAADVELDLPGLVRPASVRSRRSPRNMFGASGTTTR